MVQLPQAVVQSKLEKATLKLIMVVEQSLGWDKYPQDSSYGPSKKSHKNISLKYPKTKCVCKGIEPFSSCSLPVPSLSKLWNQMILKPHRRRALCVYKISLCFTENKHQTQHSHSVTFKYRQASITCFWIWIWLSNQICKHTKSIQCVLVH